MDGLYLCNTLHFDGEEFSRLLLENSAVVQEVVKPGEGEPDKMYFLTPKEIRKRGIELPIRFPSPESVYTSFLKLTKKLKVEYSWVFIYDGSTLVGCTERTSHAKDSVVTSLNYPYDPNHPWYKKLLNMFGLSKLLKLRRVDTLEDLLKGTSIYTIHNHPGLSDSTLARLRGGSRLDPFEIRDIRTSCLPSNTDRNTYRYAIKGYEEYGADHKDTFVLTPVSCFSYGDSGDKMFFSSPQYAYIFREIGVDVVAGSEQAARSKHPTREVITLPVPSLDKLSRKLTRYNLNFSPVILSYNKDVSLEGDMQGISEFDVAIPIEDDKEINRVIGIASFKEDYPNAKSYIMCLFLPDTAGTEKRANELAKKLGLGVMIAHANFKDVDSERAKWIATAFRGLVVLSYTDYTIADRKYFMSGASGKLKSVDMLGMSGWGDDPSDAGSSGEKKGKSVQFRIGMESVLSEWLDVAK